MNANLGKGFEFEYFHTEQVQRAEQLARETNGSICSWKTTGKANWLEEDSQLSMF